MGAAGEKLEMNIFETSEEWPRVVERMQLSLSLSLGKVVCIYTVSKNREIYTLSKYTAPLIGSLASITEVRPISSEPYIC